MNITTKIAMVRLVKLIDRLKVCPGHPDEEFLELVDRRKGVVKSASGNIQAHSDNFFPVTINGKVYPRTIRTAKCELLVHKATCDTCKKYRSNLRTLRSKAGRCRSEDEGTSASSCTNLRYLNTPKQKKRMASLRAEVNSKTAQVNRKTKEIEELKSRLKETTEERGIIVEKDMEDDLS